MYNTVYLYVFQYHAKLCLSESLEACCYWKTGWKEEGVTTGGRDNHTVCIFPWCVPWYFVQSDVFMQRQIKHCTHASHTHAHTHTHTHTHTRTLKWQRWSWYNGRHAGFPQERTISHMTTVNTHTQKHTHTHTHTLDGKSTKISRCAFRIYWKTSVLWVCPVQFLIISEGIGTMILDCSVQNSHRLLQSCSDCEDGNYSNGSSEPRKTTSLPEKKKEKS